MTLSNEQRENIVKRLGYIEDNNLFDAHLINDMKLLLASEQAWKEKYDKTKEMLDARLIFINNGQNEEQWAMQERGIQAEEQLHQAIEVLNNARSDIVRLIADYPNEMWLDEDKQAWEDVGNVGIASIDRFLSQEKEEAT